MIREIRRHRRILGRGGTSGDDHAPEKMILKSKEKTALPNLVWPLKSDRYFRKIWGRFEQYFREIRGRQGSGVRPLLSIARMFNTDSLQSRSILEYLYKPERLRLSECHSTSLDDVSRHHSWSLWDFLPV